MHWKYKMIHSAAETYYAHDMHKYLFLAENKSSGAFYY